MSALGPFDQMACECGQGSPFTQNTQSGRELTCGVGAGADRPGTPRHPGCLPQATLRCESVSSDFQDDDTTNDSQICSQGVRGRCRVWVLRSATGQAARFQRSTLADTVRKQFFLRGQGVELLWFWLVEEPHPSDAFFHISIEVAERGAKCSRDGLSTPTYPH